MKPILATISFMALATCLISSIICADNGISAETNKMVLLAGTIVWFVITPFWLRRKKS